MCFMPAHPWGLSPAALKAEGAGRCWLSVWQSPLYFLKQTQDPGKGEKFFSAGVSTPVPGRASPAAQGSSGSARPHSQ